MKILVEKWIPVPGQVFDKYVKEEIDAIAIKAIEYEGAGTCTPKYSAKDVHGNWYSFFKKDNTGRKIPTAKQLTWGPWKICEVRNSGHRVNFREALYEF